MRRRDLIAVGTAVALAAPASRVLASDKAEAPSEAPTVNIAGVGLPVIAGGRIRNYVFVTIRLHVGGGQTLETVRAKDPFFRDAIVRTAHRAPFTLADDWTKLNETAINAAVMAIANVVVGHGGVVRSEVLMQTPRRRTGVLQPV